jgi:hypothetical protein
LPFRGAGLGAVLAGAIFDVHLACARCGCGCGFGRGEWKLIVAFLFIVISASFPAR